MVTEAGPDQQTPGDRPLVSVIVPSYNSETHVLQTLQSVLSQTMRDLEVLAVDDASQDRTRSLIQALAERDPRPWRATGGSRTPGAGTSPTLTPTTCGCPRSSSARSPS